MRGGPSPGSNFFEAAEFIPGHHVLPAVEIEERQTVPEVMNDLAARGLGQGQPPAKVVGAHRPELADVGQDKFPCRSLGVDGPQGDFGKPILEQAVGTGPVLGVILPDADEHTSEFKIAEEERSDVPIRDGPQVLVQDRGGQELSARKQTPHAPL